MSQSFDAEQMAQPQFDELLAFANDVADLSGQAILPFFRRSISVENKGNCGDFDPVTAADKAAEQAIVAAVSKRWPAHGILGEEFGAHRGDADMVWVVDPIDGTRSFIMGYPTWGTLIGLLGNKTPVLGVMDQPFTGERFWSSRTASHHSDASGREYQLKTRECAGLENAIASTTHPGLFEPGLEQDGFGDIKARAQMTRYGGDCYQYCMLAAGMIDVVIEAGLKSYDIAALIPIIERAGGRVSTWTGKSATDGGRIVASGDPRLHDELLKLLN